MRGLYKQCLWANCVLYTWTCHELELDANANVNLHYNLGHSWLLYSYYMLRDVISNLVPSLAEGHVPLGALPNYFWKNWCHCDVNFWPLSLLTSQEKDSKFKFLCSAVWTQKYIQDTVRGCSTGYLSKRALFVSFRRLDSKASSTLWSNYVIVQYIIRVRSKHHGLNPTPL